MKKLLITLTLTAGLAGAAEGRLSLADRMLLRSNSTPARAAVHAPAKAAIAPAGNTLVFIVLSDGATAEDLQAEGVSVSNVRGNIALASVSTDDLERVSELPAVSRLEISRLKAPSLDRARPSGGVSALHEGLQLDQPFTGKGVVAAVVDGGLDPNHINFRDENGKSRIEYLGHVYVDYKQPDGWKGVEYDGEHVPMFTTDDASTFHGTHTLGILAGGYRGNVQAGIINNSQVAPVSTVANPYYGVATEAHLAAVCGDLYDRLIAEGIERILDYAYYKQEPCVISLSLGSNTGVHSAKSTMSQYLDMAAREAIIVVSSGNEGDVPLSLIKDLNDNDLEAKSFILPTAVADIRAGQVYMYSDAPFEMQAVIYNKSRDRVSFRMPVADGQAQGTAQYYCSSNFAESEYDIVAPSFSNAFQGYVGVGWDIDDASGMYMALMDYYTKDVNDNGNYLLGFIVKGTPGQHIECFCDGFYTVLDSYGIEGWDTGSTDMSISDMACANDILVVGSYNTGDTYGALDGYTYNFKGQFTEGKISPFSSYGRLSDGRSLPHVCGPGAVIVSSCSKYYVDNKENMVDINALCARVDEDNRINYWCPAMGTSMSTPYVAGSIALWLEADPTLTIADVKEIINATSVRDAEVEAGNPVQWGAGKFDAYAGLKEVIRRSSLQGIEADSTDALMVSTSDNSHFEIFLGGSPALNVAVYSTSGALVAHESCNGDELALDLSTLTSGIYIINVNDTMSRRVIVK